ncbi:MAG: peptidoglycan-binding protein [Rhodospirillaceae bacterium]|nr:peptidoglycan-binding protein [Rhodospirillaceae bacterium]
MTFFKILVLAVCILAVPGAVTAATPKDVPETQILDQLDSTIANPLVKRVQQALIDAGYYSGDADGRMNEDTIAAIRKYQARESLVIDGIASEALVGHMETSIKVQSLLNKLQQSRELNIKMAREALLSSPETKDLLNGEDDRVANPSRDVASCFAIPSPECLLAEAVESAKAIGKEELRDWAFGEILVAQAKAGMVDEALASVRRMGDPRLILLALRDIAKSLADAGRPAEALAAVAIIPSLLKQAEALADIAAIQLKRGNAAGARIAAERLIDALGQVEDTLKPIELVTRAAVILYKAGDETAAMAELTRMEALANGNPSAYRYIAGALAEMSKTEQALAMLEKVPEPSEHTAVLVMAATAQANAGNAALAISTASHIEGERYRAVVLGRIAVAEAKDGQTDMAEDTINLALAATEKIKLPFARAYAYDRIALALTEIGKIGNSEAFELAMVSAAQISDNKLRAHRLWSIAAARRALGHTAQAETVETEAAEATEMIKSKLTQAWMFTEIALERLAEGQTGQARTVLAEAIAISKTITNAWARARALARLASTLIEVPGPDEKE